MALKFIALLLLCQLLGEGIVIWSGLPVPGPVLGMALLWLTMLGALAAAGLGRHISIDLATAHRGETT